MKKFSWLVIIAICGLLSVSLSQANAATVVYYRFGDGTGVDVGTVYPSGWYAVMPDSSGNGYDGSVFGDDGPVFTNDVPDIGVANTRALSFDGLNDAVGRYLPDAGSLSDVTIEAWIKLDEIGYTYDIFRFSRYPYIDLSNFVQLSVVNDGIGGQVLEVRIRAGGVFQLIGQSVSLGTSLVGSWNHIAFELGTGGAVIYVNGEVVGTFDNTASLDTIGTDVMWVGGVATFPYDHFPGLIDEVRLSDKRLAPWEFLLPDRTVVYYRFGDGTGVAVGTVWPSGWYAIMPDSSGNGFDGACFGGDGPIFTDDVPEIGVANTRALSFDGVNDAVGRYLPVAGSLSDATIEAWINMSPLAAPNNYDIFRFSKYPGINFGKDARLSLFNDGAGGYTLEARIYAPGLVLHAASPVGTSLIGSWNHVALELGTGGAAIYVNGKIVATATSTASLDTIGADVMWVGGVGPYLSEHFPGLIDEVRLSALRLDPCDFILPVVVDIDALCDDIGDVVDTIVPPTGTYENHGDYVSQVAHATEDAIATVTLPCNATLTDEEIDDISSCVVSERAKSSVGMPIRSQKPGKGN